MEKRLFPHTGKLFGRKYKEFRSTERKSPKTKESFEVSSDISKVFQNNRPQPSAPTAISRDAQKLQYIRQRHEQIGGG